MFPSHPHPYSSLVFPICVFLFRLIRLLTLPILLPNHYNSQSPYILNILSHSHYFLADGLVSSQYPFVGVLQRHFLASFPRGCYLCEVSNVLKERLPAT